MAMSADVKQLYTNS